MEGTLENIAIWGTKTVKLNDPSPPPFVRRPPSPRRIQVPTRLGEPNVEAFKPSVARLPRLSELLQQGLGLDTRVQLKLPPPHANAGKALQWTRKVIENVLHKGPSVFKIGLTGNPMFRFYKRPCAASPSPGYFHERDKYQYLYVVYAGATWDEASLMEAILISEFRHLPGNRNVNPGGEGRQAYDPPYFAYLVFKTMYRRP